MTQIRLNNFKKIIRYLKIIINSGEANHSNRSSYDTFKINYDVQTSSKTNPSIDIFAAIFSHASHNLALDHKNFKVVEFLKS